jgi:hypothetical protein
MIAALFSKTTAQLIITILTVIIVIGGPIVAYLFHQKLTDIKVLVNGNLLNTIKRVEVLEDQVAKLADKT